MEKILRIGVITTAHGLKGEVKVFPTTDSLDRFKQVKKVILKTKKEDIITEITGARAFKNLAIVKFAAFDDVEQVKGLNGTEIYIDRADAQPLEEGEYYIADLIGCKVVSDEGETIGILKDVLQTGANDVYVVTPDKEFLAGRGFTEPASNAKAGSTSNAKAESAAKSSAKPGSKKNSKSGTKQKSAPTELLFPVIKDCIKDVDIENNIVTVHILPGLLD